MNKRIMLRYSVLAITISLLLIGAFPDYAQSGKIFIPIVNVPESIPNGNFEKGLSDWYWYPNGSLLTSVYSRSGNYAAMLSNGSPNQVTYIQQYITVSPYQPYLVFYRRMDSSDACSTSRYMWDYYRVTINGLEVFYQSVCSPNSSTNWIRESIDLSGFALNTVMLTVEFHSDDSVSSWLYLDDFSFESY